MPGRAKENPLGATVSPGGPAVAASAYPRRPGTVWFEFPPPLLRGGHDHRAPSFLQTDCKSRTGRKISPGLCMCVPGAPGCVPGRLGWDQQDWDSSSPVSTASPHTHLFPRPRSSEGVGSRTEGLFPGEELTNPRSGGAGGAGGESGGSDGGREAAEPRCPAGKAVALPKTPRWASRPGSRLIRH